MADDGQTNPKQARFSMSSSSKTDQFGARVRFNWGFWDALSDAENQRQDRSGIREHGGRQAPLPREKEYAPYRAGYVAGWQHWREHHSVPESSDAAWVSYQSQPTNLRDDAWSAVRKQAKPG